MTSGRPAKVLYLHHSGRPDGSFVSLRELLRNLDRSRFEPVVALLRPGEQVRRGFEEAGAATLPWPGVVAFHHATAFWSDLRRPRTWPPAVETALGWRRAVRSTSRLLAETRPDVVHVNSIVLAPCAEAVRRAAIPAVWHVREMPVSGHLGLRLGALRRALLGWPGEAIFLSDVARRAWTDGRRGVVVPEPVDAFRFDPRLDGDAARRSLGIPEDAPVVLYVGGLAALKGFAPLVRALRLVLERVPGTRCVMPGAAAPREEGRRSPLARAARAAGIATAGERLERALDAAGVAHACVRLPFSGAVERLVAACDVLAFPALEDHFPRPVVEAAFMERPVVASRLPMIEEAVGDGGGALLVPPGDSAALAEALVALLRDPERCRVMGSAARASARARFDAAANARATMALYERLVRTTGASP